MALCGGPRGGSGLDPALSGSAVNVAELSSYITRTIKRFGDYAMPTGEVQEPFDGELHLDSPVTDEADG